MTAFTVCRFEKLKSFGAIGARGAHNLRLRDTPNANPEKSNITILGGLDVVSAIKEKIGDQTVRRNAVLAVECVLSASPEFFRPDDPSRAGHWDEKKLSDWRKAVEPWIAKNFPDAVSVVLHLDESTPHYQIIEAPLDANGKLNARSRFGGAGKLRAWQTSFAKAVAHLGIERGIDGSDATHTTLGEYYGNVNKKSPKLPPVKTPEPAPVRELSAMDKLVMSKKELAEHEEKQQKAKAQAEQRQREIDARNAAATKYIKALSDKANSADLAQQQAAEAKTTAAKLAKTNEQLKAEADKLRALPLGEVLQRVYGAELDGDSRVEHATQVWCLPSGEKIGVTGEKWFDNSAGRGGKGAINAVMHLEGFGQDGYTKALRILAEHFDPAAITAQRVRDMHEQAQAEVKQAAAQPLPLPEEDTSRWKHVRNWFTKVRGMPVKLIDWLYEQGIVYADKRANAVFVRSEHGAFLRGTGTLPFKKAHGGKAEGGFKIAGGGDVYLTEGPMDAVALKAVFPNATIIATGGNMLPMNELMLPSNTERVFAAFDRDKTGNEFARQAAEYFGATRAAPADVGGKAKDWSDAVRLDPALVDATWRDTNRRNEQSPGMQLG